MSTTQTRRTYSAARSYTWPPLRLYNAVADRVPPVAGSLGRVDELHEEATRATGLTDFGDPAYRPALDALHAALWAEADLTAAGRRFARGAMVGALSNRLTIQRELSTEPDIARRPVGPAIVVLGLPRSGTTLLQTPRPGSRQPLVAAVGGEHPGAAAGRRRRVGRPPRTRLRAGHLAVGPHRPGRARAASDRTSTADRMRHAVRQLLRQPRAQRDLPGAVLHRLGVVHRYETALRLLRQRSCSCSRGTTTVTAGR